MPSGSYEASPTWCRRGNRAARRGQRSRRGETVEHEDVKCEGITGGGFLRRRCSIAIALLTFHVFTLLLLTRPSSAFAEPPTQEDVFRSIGQNVSETPDSGRALGMLAAIAGGIVLLVVVGQRRGGERAPHPPPPHPPLRQGGRP